MTSFECQNNRSPSDKFRESLDSFIFFHLGADAEVEVREGGGGFMVSVQHSRVRPLSFQLDSGELAKLAGDPEALEAFLLDQLTRHRRHR